MKLTVTNAFGDYARGDDITDPDQIAAILASDNAQNVVKVTLPPEDKPAKASK